MSQLPYPVDDQFRKGQSECPSPQIVLINEHQWSYLQKRYRMTIREMQIARLVCQGLPNEQIADYLKIRLGTVKTHIRNIYRKTWVHNKIAMLLRFVEDTNGAMTAPTKYHSS